MIQATTSLTRAVPQGADFGLLWLENEYFRDDDLRPAMLKAAVGLVYIS